MGRPEQASIPAQILALQKMTVGQLREKWLELYGEPSRSCNRQYLWKRLAWRVQELAYGGLSARAKARIAELNRDGDLRFLPPRSWNPSTFEDPGPTPRNEVRPVRDLRLPVPGTVITRDYKGQEIRVSVLEKGFEFEGRPYRSLSAVARAITGQKWNGWLFFGLTNRERKV